MTAPSARQRTKPRKAPQRSPERATPSKSVQEPQKRSGDPQPLRADQLLTAEQLSDRWQIPKSHVYRLTRSGAVPAVRLGKYYRYRIDDIERWEREGGVTNA